MKYTVLGAVTIFTLYSVSTAVLMITFTMLVAASQDTLVNKMRASTGMIKKTGGGIITYIRDGINVDLQTYSKYNSNDADLEMHCLKIRKVKIDLLPYVMFIVHLTAVGQGRWIRSVML